MRVLLYLFFSFFCEPIFRFRICCFSGFLPFSRGRKGPDSFPSFSPFLGVIYIWVGHLSLTFLLRVRFSVYLLVFVLSYENTVTGVRRRDSD